jgi:hypothetical protein
MGPLRASTPTTVLRRRGTTRSPGRNQQTPPSYTWALQTPRTVAIMMMLRETGATGPRVHACVRHNRNVSASWSPVALQLLLLVKLLPQHLLRAPAAQACFQVARPRPAGRRALAHDYASAAKSSSAEPTAVVLPHGLTAGMLQRANTPLQSATPQARNCYLSLPIQKWVQVQCCDRVQRCRRG